MAKNAEYDSAWCADHETESISPSKNQFLRSKFLCQTDWGEKISLKLENIIGKKTEYDSTWCADHEKLHFSPSKNQF